jgi:hypothetical protein
MYKELKFLKKVQVEILCILKVLNLLDELDDEEITKNLIKKKMKIDEKQEMNTQTKTMIK